MPRLAGRAGSRNDCGVRNWCVVAGCLLHGGRVAVPIAEVAYVSKADKSGIGRVVAILSSLTGERGLVTLFSFLPDYILHTYSVECADWVHSGPSVEWDEPPGGDRR